VWQNVVYLSSIEEMTQGDRVYFECPRGGASSKGATAVFDNLRDNWWCKPWNDSNAPGVKLAPLSVPALVSSEQEALASAEYQRLQQLPDSVALLGQRVVDYANAHPDDPQVPQALALTVRASHYACQNGDSATASDSKSSYTPVSRAAFQLLHRRYPKSPWTAKTPYHY
jgi:hypothetical protein